METMQILDILTFSTVLSYVFKVLLFNLPVYFLKLLMLHKSLRFKGFTPDVISVSYSEIVRECKPLHLEM